jgi:hypothetical protein
LEINGLFGIENSWKKKRRKMTCVNSGMLEGIHWPKLLESTPLKIIIIIFIFIFETIIIIFK